MVYARTALPGNLSTYHFLITEGLTPTLAADWGTRLAIGSCWAHQLSGELQGALYYYKQLPLDLSINNEKEEATAIQLLPSYDSPSSIIGTDS